MGLGRGTVCYVGVTIPEGEGTVLGENVLDKSNTPMNCKLEWSMQRRARNRGRCLIASVGRVYDWPQKGVGLHTVGEVRYLLFSCY